MNRIWQRPEILAAAFYSLTFVLTVVPYYNWLYRVTANSLHVVSFWISLSVIALTFIRLCVHKHRFGRVFVVIALGVLVLFAGSQVHRWRYLITDAYIQDNCCGVNEPEIEDLVLGGIKRIKVEGIESTGAFENDSHCVFVLCTEEFFYCD